MDYEKKYLKYKAKYLELKKQQGSSQGLLCVTSYCKSKKLDNIEKYIMAAKVQLSKSVNVLNSFKISSYNKFSDYILDSFVPLKEVKTLITNDLKNFINNDYINKQNKFGQYVLIKPTKDNFDNLLQIIDRLKKYGNVLLKKKEDVGNYLLELLSVEGQNISLYSRFINFKNILIKYQTMLQNDKEQQQYLKNIYQKLQQEHVKLQQDHERDTKIYNHTIESNNKSIKEINVLLSNII